MSQHNKITVIEVIHPTIGGAALNVAQITSGLDNRKISCTVISPSNGWLQAKLYDAGISYRTVELTRNVQPLHDFKCLISLYKIFKIYKPDIVHAHSSKAGFLSRSAARLNRVPVVIYTPHGFAFYQYKGISRIFFYWIERFVSSFADKVVCVSESERQSTLSLKVASEDRLVVINNGINADLFRNKPRGKLRKLIGLDQETIVISMVSRLAPPKKSKDLVHALDILVKDHMLTNISVVFIGGGPLEESTKRLVDVLDLDDHFYFIGDREDVPAGGLA